MHNDLLIVLKPFSIADTRTGRRELRPGTAVNLDLPNLEELIRRGYLKRIAPAAPLFAESPATAPKPMKRKRD